jgi:hypothetical protein
VSWRAHVRIGALLGQHSQTGTHQPSAHQHPYSLEPPCIWKTSVWSAPGFAHCERYAGKSVAEKVRTRGRSVHGPRWAFTPWVVGGAFIPPVQAGRTTVWRAFVIRWQSCSVRWARAAHPSKPSQRWTRCATRRSALRRSGHGVRACLPPTPAARHPVRRGVLRELGVLSATHRAVRRTLGTARRSLRRTVERSVRRAAWDIAPCGGSWRTRAECQHW